MFLGRSRSILCRIAIDTGAICDLAFDSENYEKFPAIWHYRIFTEHLASEPILWYRLKNGTREVIWCAFLFLS